MALIDSEAAFEARCEKLSPGLKDLFKVQAIKTFSALSFAIGTPQSAVSDTDMKAFSDKVYGREATLGEAAIVKRLHFESNTIVMMDLKSQASVGDSSEPSRKLPFVEKQRRLSAQETRITGLTHRNEQQPSHALIDACFTMVESGALIYLPPSKCGSRDSEVHSDNKAKQKQILTLEQGTLKSVHQDNLTQVDVGTELKLMFAFQRRGLAFDLVNLVSWDVHTAWTNKLYRALMAEPPTGFASVSLSQLLRADQELFSLLASEFQKPLKAAAVDDKPPLDAEISKLMADPRINVFLTPLPKHEKKSVTEIPVKNKFEKDGRQQSLSKACKDVGLRATAVEKDKNRSENFAIFPCDLTNAEDFLQLQNYIEAESEALVHAHFAPSCGTCSRAREIPVPGLTSEQQPRPLRSDLHPDGLPFLSEREQERVTSANESYQAMVGSFCAKFLRRSLELKEQEAKLHESLPAHLQQVLKGKKLLLWKEILVDLQYPDAGVIDDAIKGFSLTGWVPDTGVFEPWVRKPDYSLEHLLKLAPALNAAVTGSLTSAAETEHDQFVWDETQAEVNQGWLTPTVHSHPECIAKRFPLPQANKVRLIDDFSINGVNGAYGLREKLRVQSVDELCSYIAYMMDNTSDSNSPSLVGRTFDLKHAYRQFGVDEYHHDLLKIAVKKPGDTYELFNVGALPFGAVGSVSAFLRISSCLSFIGTVGLSIIWTAFFDDFTAVCDEHETENLTFCAGALFRMLGVWFADSGDKAPPFTKTFKSLGLLFSFENLKKGSFSLEHTEKRRAELDLFLSELLQKPTCNTKDLERLHGRLIWFNSFCFGRRMNSLIRILSNFSHMSSKSISVCDKLKGTLLELKSHVDSAAPVEIGRDINTTWIVFTDGSYEPSSEPPAAIGAVLVSPQGQVVQSFGEYIPASLTAILLRESEHPIYELEILPLIIVAAVWKRFLAGAMIVFYVDNDAAKSAFIQGTSPTNAGRTLLDQFTALEANLRLYPWFGRVPSASNPADPPSRMFFDLPFLKSGLRIRINFPAHLEGMGLATGELGSTIP
eukprot:s179_g39.t2